MAVINLFPDQLELIDKTRDAMRRNKSVLMQASTGSGKTIMGSYMINSAVAKGSRCIFLVPRRELMRQTAKTMDKYGIAHGFIAAGYRENPFAKVHIATNGTLSRRLDMVKAPDLLFVDECHFGGDEINRIIAWAKAARSWIIGLSATPLKTNGKPMGDWFDEMVMGPSIGWLIQNKRLSDYELYQPNIPDLSGIKSSNGDYNKSQLSEYMEQDKVLIGSAVKHYKELAMGKLNIGFCTSIKHAEITAQTFRDAGIPAAHVSGNMDDAEIARRIKAFARREILTLTNCDLMTFGFDLSAAADMDVTIESMSDLRPTKSLPLQLQKWGRVLRYKDHPAIMLDHAGNSKPDQHGLPDSDRAWALEGKESKKGGEKAEPTRQCPECYFVARPSPICPHCGFVHPIASRVLDEVEGELIKAERDQQQKQTRMEQGRAKTMAELIVQGKARGMKNPHAWAAHVFNARMAKNAT
jgi:superfamily II DNA or RNA helicase